MCKGYSDCFELVVQWVNSFQSINQKDLNNHKNNTHRSRPELPEAADGSSHESPWKYKSVTQTGKRPDR